MSLHKPNLSMLTALDRLETAISGYILATVELESNPDSIIYSAICDSTEFEVQRLVNEVSELQDTPK